MRLALQNRTLSHRLVWHTEITGQTRGVSGLVTRDLLNTAEPYLEEAKLRDVSYCPTILLSIAGPWVCISGAVFLHCPIIQPLTHLLWAGERPLGFTAIQQASLERALYCLSTVIPLLRQYYSGLRPALLAPPKGLPHFPYIRHYGSRYFTYVEELAPNREESLVFKAKRDDAPEQFLVIKFTEKYNAQAHQLLAEAGYAPRLHHEERLHQGLVLLIMDYVKGVHPLEALTDTQYAQVEGAIKLLHENDIVFGDLRRPNLLVHEDEVKIIDFDVCGKDGKDVYPLEINMDGGIGWADGVGPRTVMKKEHDLHMMDKLRSPVVPWNPIGQS